MDGQKEIFNLTHPQRSIWTLEQLNQGSGIGNISATLRIDEDLDYEVMNRIINEIIRKNDAFRTRLIERDGDIIQYFEDYAEYRMPFYDFSQSGAEDLYSWDESQSNIPFEMTGSQLFNFSFLKIGPGSSAIYIRIHHMIADAWSLVQAANEIMEHYSLNRRGMPWSDEAYPSYSEFIRSEQAYLASDRYESDRQFWREEFADSPELTTLKIRTPRGVGLRVGRKSSVIPDKLTAKIREHCRESRTSIFSLFFSALCLYITRVRDTRDITIGTPVLNRTNAREKKMIGMFISTVPLRIQTSGEQSFSDFSRQVDHKWFAVLKHQKFPFDHLLRDVRECHQDVDKLFDIAISYQNAKMVENQEGYWHEARWHRNNCQTESLYLHINDRETDGKIVLNYDYLTDLFFAREMDYLHDHILRLLWHALDNPEKEMSRIHMLSEEESHKILKSFHANRANYPAVTITDLFEKQVRLRPEHPALTSGRETLSYRQLNNRANYLAARLRRAGVGPEVLVGLLLPRSISLVVAILGIIKAGGAYLPIDPDYPEERIRTMLEDSKAGFLVVRREQASQLGYDGEVVDLHELMASYRSELVWEDPPVVNAPGDLLYVIYTSGSTGLPKGVMIEHRNVVQLLFNDRFQFDFGPGDCWSLFHTVCFDFSVWEMYGALLYGGRLVIISREAARNTDLFLEILRREKVTILNQTPAAFYNLIESERKSADRRLSVRTVIFGGEALKPTLLKPFRVMYPATRLINMYGITETTVHVTFVELSDSDLESSASNIGRPLPTMKVYILDRNLSPQPIGAPGELCVSGGGVGRGYLHNEALTRARFVPNPFEPGETMYRSGDLARFFAEGDIEYLGRIDSQVKIRGHRIELGEIETCMMKFGKIREAVVTMRETAGGQKRLCAYYVPSADFEIDEIRTYLSRFLTEYMLPAFFISMDKLPLNNNGKIDRARLPEPDPEAIYQDTYVEPQNEAQAFIARIFQETLEISRIGINDNFFRLGGDSLTAMVVVTQIGHGVTFADLYQNPTARSLGEVIAGSGASSRPSADEAKPHLLIRLSKEGCNGSGNIICFPYGGGNGTIYMDLADALEKSSSQFCVYTVQLPGRELVRTENMPENGEIATDLAREIKQFIQGEITLYGHCVGSALALETAEILRRDEITVKSVFVGGMMPPGNAWLLGRNFDPWKYASNKLILRYLRALGLSSQKRRKDHMSILIDAFRHDVRNFYKYFYDRDKRKEVLLDTPLHFIVGGKDLMTRSYRKNFVRWGRYAKTVKLYVIKDARHYFINTHPDELARILAGQR